MLKYCLTTILLSFISLSAIFSQEQEGSTLSLLFIGDIMGHDSQINSAFIGKQGYSYETVFRYIKEEISEVDVAIANLEVTLAGPPYKGYPQFSSPDELAKAAKESGIDAFVTANNHSCDRFSTGIKRTISVLDSLKVQHTGTFKTPAERKQCNLMVFDKKGIKIGVLNYTYGTNGIPVRKPTVVNMLDKELMKQDIMEAKEHKLDKLILFLHWGTEYQSNPSIDQEKLADYLFSLGVDIIIGSHPHVIQKMEHIKNKNKEKFIAYSLGNFVSNQRKRKTDGGCMVKLVLKKENSVVKIKESGYYLTWVYKQREQGRMKFYVIPCSKYENDESFFKTGGSFSMMKTFMTDSRKLFEEKNIEVKEYMYKDFTWDRP